MNVGGLEYELSVPGAYTMPEHGIPKSDMSAEVQSSLDKADNSVQKVAGKGLSTNDFTNEDKELIEQTTPAAILGLQQDVVGKYTKPQAGIPASDMANAVQALLEKAGTAVQPAALEEVTDLIPQEATAQNKLADKAFVNSSISTATATFQGSYNLVTDLSLSVSASQAQIASALGTAVSVADNNDYAFVQIPTSDVTPTEIARVERYKYNGSAWAYEFALNNSGFTAAQWAALNSGITSGLVSKLLAMPTNSELATLLSGKQDVINDLANIRTGSQYNVKFDVQALTNQQKAQARANIGAGTYDKPSAGIPASDLAYGVIPDVSLFVTKTVNDLVNYYLKDDTYTKAEVQALIAAIQGMEFVPVSILPTASADTLGKIYLVPAANPQTGNQLDEYYTKDNGAGAQTRYTWELFGSAAVNLSGYVTTAALNTALAAYTTTADLTTLLANKEDTSNKVTSLSAQSTNTQYPGAKATYDEIHPAVASSQPAGGMLPNKLYKLGTLTGNVTIAFSSPADNNIENEYKFSFTAGAGLNLSWPSSSSSWVWAGNALDNGLPNIEDGSYYEVSVEDGIAIINKFE